MKALKVKLYSEMEKREMVVYLLFEPGDTCRLAHGGRRGRGGEEKTDR